MIITFSDSTFQTKITYTIKPSLNMCFVLIDSTVLERPHWQMGQQIQRQKDIMLRHGAGRKERTSNAPIPAVALWN